MFPVPFVDYIPQFYERDDKLNAFADKMDSIIAGIKEDTLGLNDFIDPVKAPSVILDKLGYYLSAGIKAQDTDRQKRTKIATAIQGHKQRGSFTLDAKPKIDLIAGGDSQIIKSVGSDDWILVGDGTTPASYYYAAMGADGIDDELGIALIGEGTEIVIAGNVYIDVDNNSLSADDQDRINQELLDIVPVYYYVHVGYLDMSGAFVEYFVMGT